MARPDQSDDCPHVAETGSHRFEWINKSFAHAFGTHSNAGYGYCDCGADPNDHGMYDRSY
jgi:hypothetical protein